MGDQAQLFLQLCYGFNGFGIQAQICEFDFSALFAQQPVEAFLHCLNGTAVLLQLGGIIHGLRRTLQEGFIRFDIQRLLHVGNLGEQAAMVEQYQQEIHCGIVRVFCSLDGLPFIHIPFAVNPEEMIRQARNCQAG